MKRDPPVRTGPIPSDWPGARPMEHFPDTVEKEGSATEGGASPGR